MNVLWSEKCRPESFDALTFNSDVNQTLQNLVAQGDMPHLILYGPDGSGKRTRVNCLLTKLYGHTAMRITRTTFSTKNNATVIEVPIRTSKNHIEIMPSEAGHNDVFVLMKLMKETAANAMVSDTRNHFLTFVINDAENLSLKAQAALRRTMEKYANNIRVVMVCLSTASLIPALKSRCLMIRNPAPTEHEVIGILSAVVKREGLKKVTDQNVMDVAAKCDRNVRRALLSLQAAVARNDFSGAILEEHWKNVVADKVVAEILKNRAVETVKATRNVFYDLLACQVCGDNIIREILWQLLAKLDVPDKAFRVNNKDELGLELREAAANCEKKMRQGSRDIIYLEAFLVKAMLAFEKHITK